MRYTDTNVSDWFRPELADLLTATLDERGPTPKGALIVAVMEKRGLKPHEGNMLMRAHVDDLLCRGVFVSHRQGRKTIVIGLADGVEDRKPKKEAAAEIMLSAPSDTGQKSAAPPVSHGLFEALISGLTVRMNEITENLATQNEATAFLIRESSAIRQGIAMVLEGLDARFARIEQAIADRLREIARELSAIREALVSGDAGVSGDTAILTALEDLSRKLNEPDDVVRWLGSSHAMLRDLLSERNNAVNHSSVNTGGD